MKKINRHGIVAAKMSYNSYKEYFCIEALEDGLQAKLSVNACEYSLDGNTWNSLPAATNTLAVNTNEKIYFRGNLTPTSSNGIGTFTISKKCNVKGNIMSLLYGDDFEGQTDLTGKNYAFYDLFYYCNNIVDASELILPATTLAYGCYNSMFYGCSSLVTAPELPATTLANYCYSYMFNGCKSLTTAPALPATTLAEYCYHNIFSYCTNLVNAPALPATTLAEYCYHNIFSYCTNLVTAPALPATTLAYGCYNSMFQSCTNLTTAPELPAKTLASNCYGSMFQSCTNLTTAPALPATTLAYGCYSNMFSYCTNLVTAPALPATTLATYCYRYMFQGCSNLITATALPATTLAIDCYEYMFEGCTSLVTAPELPATTLVDYCYRYMFNGCSKLSNITMLATDISASSCLFNWVSGVSSSGTFTKHKDMTSLPSGVSGIPEGWTVEDYRVIINDNNNDDNNIHNGHKYVDLGLPSGTLWATSVIGGDNPLYFAWGGTEGATKEQIESGEFLFGIDDIGANVGSLVPYMSDMFTLTKYNATDGKRVLDLEDDAAHVHMGDDWHMPTKEQLEELTANTTSIWATKNGVNGMLLTSNVNGKSVFVPAFGNASDEGNNGIGSYGYIWSSSVDDDYFTYAWCLDLDSFNVNEYNIKRFFGIPVLGVIG